MYLEDDYIYYHDPWTNIEEGKLFHRVLTELISFYVYIGWPLTL